MDMGWRLICTIIVVGPLMDQDDSRPVLHRGHLED